MLLYAGAKHSQVSPVVKYGDVVSWQIFRKNDIKKVETYKCNQVAVLRINFGQEDDDFKVSAELAASTARSFCWALVMINFWGIGFSWNC